MQNIIEFLGQYWGYTIAGSLTVGGLVLALLGLIKTYFINKKNMQSTEALKATMLTLLTTYKDENNLLRQLVEAGDKKIKELELTYIRDNKRAQVVQAAMFKSLSYLIMASKLPTEDKIALQENFAALTNKPVEEVKAAGEEVEQIVEAIEDKGVEDTIIETVEHAQTLLEKYKGE